MSAHGRPAAGYEALPQHTAITVQTARELQASEYLKRAADLEPQRLLAKLDTSEDGLTHGEAQRRLQRFGRNVVAAGAPPAWWHVAWAAAAHPFNAILLFLAGTAYLTEDLATVAIMLAMVAFSVSLRFWQEMKSTVAAACLRGLVQTHAKAVRRPDEGFGPEEVSVEQSEVVPGDVVRLFAGELIPGDVRLLAARDLFVGEAALTGESMPVEKAAAAGAAPGLLDCRGLCFMGTHVVSGAALGVVVATGSSTYLSSMAGTQSRARPPNAFQRGVARVSWLLIAFMVVMVPVVVAISGLQTGDWYQAALFGISVAVGLTPEMLPMVVNANLARGAMAMSRQRCIVKSLDAVQNLGAMDTLCTDKTGTLTVDHVVLTRWLDWRGAEGAAALRWAFLNSYFQTGLRNLLDAAILREGGNNGLGKEAERFEMVDELPFDFCRRRLSVVLQADGCAQLVCKGAYDEILALCASIDDAGTLVDMTDSRRQGLLQLGKRLNCDGLRVLAVAVKDLASLEASLAPRAPGRQPLADAANRLPASPSVSVSDESSMTFIGFVCFLDPPKDTAAQAVRELAGKGVVVRVLTGDHAAVACHVCHQVGIPADHVLTGAELERLPPAEFGAAVERATVFAKLSPLQKAQVVEALKRRHTVGFLGDGINDALALRAADVGVAVDTGTEIAKDTADVILLEKSLLVLETGVVTGRVTHGNTIKYLKMGASSNLGNVLSILVASAWVPFQPMTPIQLLTQNLLYDTSQISIPFDTMDDEYVARPRAWSAAGLGRFMLCIGPTSSVFDVTTFALLWFYYGARTPERQALFQTGWFTVGICTQTLIVHMIRTERTILQSVASPPVLAASVLVSLVGVMLPYTAVGRSEGMVELPGSFYGFLVATVLSYSLLVQLAKVLYMRAFKSWL